MRSSAEHQIQTVPWRLSCHPLASADVLTLIFADGWLKILPVVVAWIQGFQDGGWANEGRGGRRAFLLIPLKRENVQAPFAELSCAEV